MTVHSSNSIMSELLSACEESFVMGDMDLIWSCRTRNLILFYLHYQSPLGWRKVSSGKEQRHDQDMLNWWHLRCCHRALSSAFLSLEVNKSSVWKVDVTLLLVEYILCFLWIKPAHVAVLARTVNLCVLCLSVSHSALGSLINLKGNRLRLTSSVIICHY